MALILSLLCLGEFLSAHEIRGYDIIVVAGQSNAAGWGFGGPESNSNTQVSDQRIYQWVWSKDTSIIAAQNPIQSPAVTNPKKTHGFALPFAQNYAQAQAASHPERAVLIINAAVGGSSINDWATEGKLYRQTIGAVQTSLSQSPHNKVVAVLWHQGEADIKLGQIKKHDHGQIKAYGVKLENIIKNFRKDIPEGENLPFIAGEMSRRWQEATAYRKSYVAQINETILKTEHAGFVSSENLRGNKLDQIHFNGESQKILGLRYFQAYQQILGKNPSCHSIFQTN